MSRLKAWYSTVLLLLVMAVLLLWLLAERQNVQLKKQNEQLILRNDSLHMLQIKTRKELMYSNNKIDSLYFNLSFKKKRY